MSNFITVPIKCIEDYSDELSRLGIQSREEQYEFRKARFNVNHIMLYYTKPSTGGTVIEMISGGAYETSLSVEEIDDLLSNF